MSRIMERAFGASRPAPQIDVEATDGDKKLSPQEKMMVSLLKSIAPNLDFEAISKLGEDAQEFAGRVATTLAAHTEALQRIEENQKAIAVLLDELSQHEFKGFVATSPHTRPPAGE